MKARKKRMCYTIIFLLDSTQFSQHDQEIRKVVHQLGDLFEIESTMTRDLVKYTDCLECNSYIYWLKTTH